MKYAHVLNYVARTPWAILPAKMDEILSVIAYRASGQEFTPEEIAARLGPAEEVPAPSQLGSGVAVVQLRGTIAHRIGSMAESSGGMSAERFGMVIRRLSADESIGSILIDVDSPGGTVTGVPEAAQAVFDARKTKRVVAIANGAMGSAAYWIASQAAEVVALPSVFDGVIGSIGVFCVHRNLAAALEKEGIAITLLSAGEHKLDGNPFGPLSPEVTAEMQAEIDVVYDRFVRDVARGRGVTPAAVRKGFGRGRGLSATSAKAEGLVDRLATIEETLARLVGGRRSGAGRGMTAETSEEIRIVAEVPARESEASAPVPQATPQPKSDTVEPEDGECPDDYEMGEDGMCHLANAEPTDDAKAARSDGDDVLAVTIALGE